MYHVLPTDVIDNIGIYRDQYTMLQSRSHNLKIVTKRTQIYNTIRFEFQSPHSLNEFINIKIFLFIQNKQNLFIHSRI